MDDPLSECGLASPGSPCTNLEAEDCKYDFIGEHCCCGQCSDSPWLILKCVLDSTTGSKLWQSTQPDSQTCPAEGCGSKGKKSNPPPHFPYNMQYCFAIFLDAKVKRKEKCIPQSVRRSVRSQRTVGDTFGFPICQCLWDLTKLLGKQVNNAQTRRQNHRNLIFARLFTRLTPIFLQKWAFWRIGYTAKCTRLACLLNLRVFPHKKVL